MSYYNYNELYKFYGGPDSSSFRENLVKYSIDGIQILPSVHKKIVPFLDDVVYLLKKRKVNYKIKVL